MDNVRPVGGVRDELRTLAEFAWPVVLGQLGLAAMGVVDMVLVGRLGPESLGALGIANTWAFGTLLVGLGTASGIDPVVSQAYGAGRFREAGAALVRGAVVVSVVALPILAAHWFAAPCLRLLGQPEALIGTAALYCRIVGPSVPPMLAFALLRSFLQGSGKMQPAMWAIVIGNLVNAVADYALIYGHFGMPALGVAGAAGATTVVRVAMLAALLWAAMPELRRTWPGRIGLLALKPTLRMARIAFPVGIQIATEVWAFSACSVMAGWLGTTAVAAHTAALSLASLTFMIPLGISAAAATRVGNLVGAELPWTRAGWTAIGMAAGVMTVSASCFLLFPELLGRIYLDEPVALALTASVLPLAALFQLADGTQVSCFGVLRGLGDTTRPMAANLLGYCAIGLPLGWFLAFRAGWGLAGIWLGLATALILVGFMLLLRVGWHARRATTPVLSTG